MKTVKPEPRNITIKILVNKKEYAAISRRQKQREEMGLPFSLSGFVRWMALCADLGADMRAGR